MTTLVRHMLEGKSDVHAVSPDDTVLAALEVMAEKGIGAVLVMRDGSVSGILSERDYARKVVLQGRGSRETPVSEVMTSQVFSVTPAWSCEQCMTLMTEKRIRHLPVLDDGRVVGVISIGDVVRAVLAGQRDTITALEGYIMTGG
jgi:CBS domain-containing protein